MERESRKSLWRGEGTVTSINPMVVGSIPTGCESCRSSVAEQRKKSRDADSRHNKTDVVEVRVTSSNRALRATGEMRHRKAASVLRGNSSNNQREPIVPIGSAGMVRRRVTSSVERRGTVVPLLCSIFLPARICRKATELDVVKEGLLRLRRGRTWVRIPPGPCKLSSELL